ncbi:hypothetical protein AB4305_22790 [Nocardia sp. 2YAB30]|uniref:hypothetical protein n=1 Tax=unclassified Nocardia TaxID=2637762 RepID=UPI003F9A4FDB
MHPDLVRWSHIPEHLDSGIRRAFGHLGVTDDVALGRPRAHAVVRHARQRYTDPYPEVMRGIGVPYGITSETPKVADTDLAF